MFKEEKTTLLLEDTGSTFTVHQRGRICSNISPVLLHLWNISGQKQLFLDVEVQRSQHGLKAEAGPPNIKWFRQEWEQSSESDSQRKGQSQDPFPGNLPTITEWEHTHTHRGTHTHTHTLPSNVNYLRLQRCWPLTVSISIPHMKTE